jgi:glycosyltransferase involved in cell wall biosynthesis
MSYGMMDLIKRSAIWRAEPAEIAALAPDLTDYRPVDVAIVCESTYPYLTGGLSAVVHQICEANPDATIGIIHIAWDTTSPREPLYDVPPQVVWVKTVYQSLGEHAATFKKFQPKDVGLKRPQRAALAGRVIDAIDQHMKGNDDALWTLYDEGINPLTRSYRLWPILSTREFMVAATKFFASIHLPFTDLFWNLREFFSLAYAVTDEVFPEAKVYHAHTTGAAAVLAAAAARQRSARFLLTEHNLYARDTINHLLERSMDTVVTENEWRTLDTYTTSGAVPRTAKVTPAQRAWMAWWVRTGILAYRAADHITYLYPDAIDEAKGLGGIPQKSSVLPNGVTPEHFESARSLFRKRQGDVIASADRRIWNLAYAARVVPIKGLLDLLESLAQLTERGVTNWQLDVMGPDKEMPEYAEQCRARCTELGLDGHVKFLGSVNLRERFGYYDALVLPSHNEGQPIVVLEAMTMGLPTIGTYVGGMKQLVEDDLEVITTSGDSLTIGACGLLVESHDVDSLANAIEGLMADEAAFDEFSRNAQLRVEHYFHIDSAMNLYRSRYFELIAGPISAGEATAAVERVRAELETAADTLVLEHAAANDSRAA